MEILLCTSIRNCILFLINRISLNLLTLGIIFFVMLLFKRSFRADMWYMWKHVLGMVVITFFICTVTQAYANTGIDVSVRQDSTLDIYSIAEEMVHPLEM